MKRYNYWNYVKTGGWEIDYNFLYNKKNVCVNHHSHPAYSIFYHPLDHGRYKKKHDIENISWLIEQDLPDYFKSLIIQIINISFIPISISVDSG